MITEKILKLKVDEYLDHQKDENTLYVTDLVRCPLISQKYEREYKDLAIINAVNAAAIMGNFVHDSLESFLIKNFNNTQTEVEVEKKISIDGKEITIKGRMDAVIENNNEKIIVEIKSSRSDRGIPHENHKIQLKTYMWMTGIRKGLLLYITPDRITEFEEIEPMTDEEIMRLAEETIKMTKTPRYQWECKFCAFSKVCQIGQQNQNTNNK